MPTPEMLTTTVSTNGQIILPRSVRHALLWEAGSRLVVEIAPEGVMLRQAPVFFETRSGDVFGCLAFYGPSKPLAEMEAGGGSCDSGMASIGRLTAMSSFET